MLKKGLHQVFHETLSHREMHKMFKNIRRYFFEMTQKIPKEYTLGARIMVRLAAATVGIYKTLINVGYKETEAEEYTSQITWLIYEKLTTPFWRLTAFIAHSNIDRVRKVMTFFIKWFPYKYPGYDMRDIQFKSNIFAFNVYRCPVAEYFASQELTKLCVSSFCNLDYPLADIWDVILERPDVLAERAKYCNFNFKAKNE